MGLRTHSSHATHRGRGLVVGPGGSNGVLGNIFIQMSGGIFILRCKEPNNVAWEEAGHSMPFEAAAAQADNESRTVVQEPAPRTPACLRTSHLMVVVRGHADVAACMRSSQGGTAFTLPRRHSADA